MSYCALIYCDGLVLFDVSCFNIVSDVLIEHCAGVPMSACSVCVVYVDVFV